MQLNKLVLAASVLAFAAAPAMATEGWYLGAHGGLSTLQNEPTKSATTRDNPTKWNEGWLGGVSAGYNFGNGFRNEIEATYRHNNLDDTRTGQESGDVGSWAFMYNALYDLPVFGKDSKVKPYVGIGAGAVRTSVDAGGFTFGALDDTDWSFAMQGIAGVSYDLDNNWGVFADYRYLHAFNTKYSGPGAIGDVKSDYHNSSVVAGLRYTFGSAPAPMAEPVAAPAPVAQPAPAPVTENGPVSRKYLVFFDFNKATLTPEAVEVLKQAAGDAGNGRAVQLDVSGYTDRSGSDSYNNKLSAKRAAAVKAQLAKLGISSSMIQTAAKGESDPLVPTADGVKEPQNRRAEITYVIQPK